MGEEEEVDNPCLGLNRRGLPSIISRDSAWKVKAWEGGNEILSLDEIRWNRSMSMIDAREKLESTFGNYYCARYSSNDLESERRIALIRCRIRRIILDSPLVEQFEELPSELEFEISDFAIASPYKRPVICTNHPLNQARYVVRFDMCIACPSMKSIYETLLLLVRITEESTRVIVRIELNRSLIWQRSKY